VLPGLGQAALDHDVVERDRAGQEVAVARRLAQPGRHVLEEAERLAVAPRQLGQRRAQRPADGAVAEADHLVHEALEEHAVARLVDLLRGEKVLLLLARRGVDVRAERVCDGVLAVEEQREQPQRAAALLGRHPLVPVDAVLREVDLGRAPVALLPARVEVLVVDLRRRGRDRHGRGCHGAQRTAAAVTSTYTDATPIRS
jgi:hypothetical protein